MKNLMTACLLFIGIMGFAQTVTLTSPEGLTEPYEVAAGTEVTVQWDYYETPPTLMFTYDQDPGALPGDWQFSPNPEWTQHTNWTDNGDGTFDFTFTVLVDSWIWGGFNSFSGYAYSNVISIVQASSVVITAEDGKICATGDTELLSVEGTYDTYQWYMDGAMIDGETSSTYSATSAGSYYVIINDGVEDLQSNIVNVEEFTVAFTGVLNAEATELTLTGDAGMDTYQWYMNGTIIDGATNMEYVATVTSEVVNYSLEATNGSCTITSVERPVSDAYFMATTITVSADTNEFDLICDGTQITLSIDESFEFYMWYKNDAEYSSDQHIINIYNVWGSGDYYVTTSSAEWPEVSIASETINATYVEIIDPQLSGVSNYSTHCAGEELSVILTDEGYDYTWYAHSEYNYTEDDTIPASEIEFGVYTFIFSESVNITVVAHYQGCDSDKKVTLNSYADENMNIGISNYDQQYLCTDSTAHIGINWGYDKWDNYQWYQLVDTNWVMLENDTTYLYDATEPGSYKLSGVSVNCATAVVESNTYDVYDYLERNMNLWSPGTEICLGDTAIINFSDYKWENIQWLKGDINIGSGGYEMSYIPFAGDTNKVSVTELNHYIVKAKHESCPNGLKVTSDPIVITPAVNPTINLVGLDQEPNSWKQLLWDTVAFYLFCDNYPLTVAVDSGYDSYQWYEQVYAGQDDYDWGDLIDGATTNTHSTNALVQWLTVVVEQDGCVGQSNPILLDTWVFQSPAIASYDNSELCEEGDSTLMHIAFPGTWVNYNWYLDGVLIEDSNNDSIWGSELGMYVVEAFPEACPDFAYSSGVGPTVTILTAEILEGEWDTGEQFFYAIPELGYYDYQWYIDGIAYANDSDTPWILYKEGLPEGMITCEVTNPEPCTSLSNGILWDPLGIGENELESLAIYPNPTSGMLNINGLNPITTNTISLYSSVGELVRSFEVTSASLKLDIGDLPNGLYILKVQNEVGLISTYKINKL